MSYFVEFKYQDGSSTWSQSYISRDEAQKKADSIKKGPLGGSVMCVIHCEPKESTDMDILKDLVAVQNQIINSMVKKLELLEDRVKALEIPMVRMV